MGTRPNASTSREAPRAQENDGHRACGISGCDPGPGMAAAEAKERRKILEQFIAATGYHEKSAIRVLNSAPTLKLRQSRQRGSLYDEAVRAALIVLWEASDGCAESG